MEGYFLPHFMELLGITLWGAFMGSFLHVVSLNLDHLQTIVRRRSHCPKCRHDLSWYDLIPVGSYLMQGGRCRYCRAPIPARYLWAELITAAVYGSLYQALSPILLWWQLALLLIVVSFWVILLLDDWRTMSVDLGTVTQVGVGVAVIFVISKSVTAVSAQPLMDGLVGALVGGGSLSLIRYLGTKWLKQEAMGSADPWVGAFIGLVVGWPGAVVMLLASFIIGSVMGLVTMLMNRHFDTLKEVPFVPALFMAGWVTLLWGSTIVNWYTGLL